MGFADVEKDGFVIEQLKKDIKKYNEIYFGQGAQISVNVQRKGQLEQYQDSRKRYLEQQFNSVKKYFQELDWDCVENGDKVTFRANSDVYVAYQGVNSCYIEFKNRDIRKVYNVDVKSDFKENPHYVLNTSRTSGSSPRYSEKGGIATKAEVIDKKLKDIKEVVEYNDSLKGRYNFKIIVEKDNCVYNSENEGYEYDSLMAVINEISEEYF